MATRGGETADRGEGSRAQTTGSDVTGTGSDITGTGSHVVWKGKPRTVGKRERGRRADKEDAILEKQKMIFIPDFFSLGCYKRERGPEGSPEIESKVQIGDRVGAWIPLNKIRIAPWNRPACLKPQRHS